MLIVLFDTFWTLFFLYPSSESWHSSQNINVIGKLIFQPKTIGRIQCRLANVHKKAFHGVASVFSYYLGDKYLDVYSVVVWRRVLYHRLPWNGNSIYLDSPCWYDEVPVKAGT